MSDLPPAPIARADCLIISTDQPTHAGLIAKAQLREWEVPWQDRSYRCWVSSNPTAILKIGGLAIVNGDGTPVNLRAEPGQHASVVTQMRDGIRLKLLAVSTETGADRWWHVQDEVDATQGWMLGRYLKPVTHFKQVLVGPMSDEFFNTSSMDIETTVHFWQPAFALIVGLVNSLGDSPALRGDVVVSDRLFVNEDQPAIKAAHKRASPSPDITVPTALLNSVRRLQGRSWQRQISVPPVDSASPQVRLGSVVSLRSTPDHPIKQEDLSRYSGVIAIEYDSPLVLAELNRNNVPVLLIGAAVSDGRSEPFNLSDTRTAAYLADVSTTFAAAVLRDLAAGVRPLASYDSDQSGTDDRLGITPHVKALAALMASRTVMPPLSIGLFGEWGSGKSFFMDRLVDEIKSITADAHQSGRLQKEIAFNKYIAQVRFNVWHYVDTNLWISLVEHIFDQLRVDVIDDDAAALQLREKLLAELGLQTELEQQAQRRIEQATLEIGAAEKRISETTAAYQYAEQRLKEISARNVLKTVMALDSVQTEMDKLKIVRQELGLQQVQDNAEDLASAVTETRLVIDRGFKLFTPLLRAKDKEQRWVWLLIALLAPPAIGLIIVLILQFMNTPAFTQLSALLASGAAAIAAIADWLRRQAQWVSDKLAVVEGAQREIDARVEEERAQIQQQIAVLNLYLDKLKAQREVAQNDRAQAANRIAELQAEIELLTPSGRLSKFIHDRADNYRRQLGVMANIRQDFERLDHYIHRVNEGFASFKSLEEECRQEKWHLSRVILYIDDLDRCPADKVVQVLEAVHLLLGFKCFVVVVAVDARWVAGALHSRYGELLSGNTSWQPDDDRSPVRAATPLDYLEKIFQVPFWLNPMNEYARQNMLQGLVSASLATPPGADRASATGSPIGLPSPAAGTPAAANAASNVSHAPATNVTPSPSAPPIQDERDLNPDSLKFDDAEYQFMHQLAPLLGRSPRALKRFVNIYRLIKTSLSDEELHIFSPAGSGEYRIVAFLLALTTNSPEMSTLFFRELDELIDKAVEKQQAVPQEIKTLCAAVDGVVPVELRSDWLRVKSWLHITPEKAPPDADQDQPPLSITIDRLAWWARRVARYSFLMEPSALDWLESVG